MIKVERAEVFNFSGAIRGMRNPMNSWDKSDSQECITENGESCKCGPFYLGENDLGLMKKLYKAGPEHAKYLRQIFVSMDIIAPLYWWKEMDQYRIGVTTNSCSTMHRIHAKRFVVDDFSCEHLGVFSMDALNWIIYALNKNREEYLALSSSEDMAIRDRAKDAWWEMIQLLPSSYNQRRTISMSYANVMNIINQRQHHKLTEWHELCDELRKLPFVKDIRDEH